MRLKIQVWQVLKHTWDLQRNLWYVEFPFGSRLTEAHSKKYKTVFAKKLLFSCQGHKGEFNASAQFILDFK